MTKAAKKAAYIPSHETARLTFSRNPRIPDGQQKVKEISSDFGWPRIALRVKYGRLLELSSEYPVRLCRYST